MLTAAAKAPSRLTQAEWRNLAQQVWPIYPAAAERSGGHPAPFPAVLPLRLIRLYTFRAAPDAGFAGDIVLDMFSGSGATVVAAKASGRRWIGIDLHPGYCAHATARLQGPAVNPHAIMLAAVRVRAARDSRQPPLL